MSAEGRCAVFLSLYNSINNLLGGLAGTPSSDRSCIRLHSVSINNLLGGLAGTPPSGRSCIRLVLITY